jgi:hypothetical protein
LLFEVIDPINKILPCIEFGLQIAIFKSRHRTPPFSDVEQGGRPSALCVKDGGILRLSHVNHKVQQLQSSIISSLLMLLALFLFSISTRLTYVTLPQKMQYVIPVTVYCLKILIHFRPKLAETTDGMSSHD